MLKRRTLLATGAAALTPLALPTIALAQRKKDALVIGLTLEPTGLDPTAKAGAEIAEVVLYTVFETLTKINSDGGVTPLLAESWEVSPDLKTDTFKLRRGVKFQNGEPFNAQSVKFSFDRAAAANSTNKDKRTFTNIATQVVDEHTVVLINKEIEPDLLFLLGQASAILVEPKSVETNATKPVGTGPYRLDNWAKGSSIVLAKWDGWRGADTVQIRKATFRFISEPRYCRTTSTCSRMPRCRAACRSSRTTSASRSSSTPRSARPSWPSTTSASRWTTCACAAPSRRPSTARP